MRKIINMQNILAVIFLLVAFKLKAQEVKTFPVPPDDGKMMFYLQRTPNTNTIVYELNYENGVLNSEEPIHVYWRRYTEKGQKAELSYIQRHFAYGIKTKSLGTDYYEMHIVAYKKKVLYLKKASNNAYYVFTIVNNKTVLVKRIFIQINGGTFWSPNVEYVEFKGIDLVTGKETTEQIKVK
jgi:hypothetical protein